MVLRKILILALISALPALTSSEAAPNAYPEEPRGYFSNAWAAFNENDQDIYTPGMHAVLGNAAGRTLSRETIKEYKRQLNEPFLNPFNIAIPSYALTSRFLPKKGSSVTNSLATYAFSISTILSLLASIAQAAQESRLTQAQKNLADAQNTDDAQSTEKKVTHAKKQLLLAQRIKWIARAFSIMSSAAQGASEKAIEGQRLEIGSFRNKMFAVPPFIWAALITAANRLVHLAFSKSKNKYITLFRKTLAFLEEHVITLFLGQSAYHATRDYSKLTYPKPTIRTQQPGIQQLDRPATPVIQPLPRAKNLQRPFLFNTRTPA